MSPVCRTWGKLEERLGRKVGGKTWGKLERGGEICRKVRRVVGRRREEDVEKEVGKFVGRCGEYL